MEATSYTICMPKALRKRLFQHRYFLQRQIRVYSGLMHDHCSGLETSFAYFTCCMPACRAPGCATNKRYDLTPAVWAGYVQTHKDMPLHAKRRSESCKPHASRLLADNSIAWITKQSCASHD